MTDAESTGEPGPDRGWDGAELDLEAYLARIGHAGDRSPTEATLRALHRAHVLGVPFENLEIVLGRPVPLDLPALQDKIVRRARGGYCFEHARLFAAALERLGFGVGGLTSRVGMGSGRVRPATHAVLRVETAETAETGRVWICDVGFGGSPLEPLELADGARTSADGWEFRLERTATPLGATAEAEEWTLHERRGAGEDWSDLHAFTLNPQYAIDWAVGNHYVSTHPRSPFVRRPIVQRTGPDVRQALYGATWVTTARADGSRLTRELKPREVPEVLGDVFGIGLDAADAEALAGAVERLPADGPVGVPAG
ncbi:arylamine N-acetyltransferase family protein [Streptomyces radiopugnans]|uniref:N-hydroxyarylamine O-acetyltransferase n=1 Tax=Streptomyces radiopugnans TaxID=403935 RepID=A0A1H9H0R6_9ACTN|nr:arylamine N-acetyltransferase [Streptomyces radiopugnans]SEQ55853.1 N-hydroxyarylamine O-acetyltransferase [Streptomyces radiopugnans]